MAEGTAAGVHAGGCHCGRIRFTARGSATSSGWCHCSICRRTTGAPALAWVSFPADAVEITGEPAVYRSSDQGVRLFCPACGAQIAYVADAPKVGGGVAFNTGVFDDPAAFPPTAHGYFADRVPWFDAGRGLPAVDDGDA